MAQDRVLNAMTNRSIRTIRTELEFLADASLLSPNQLSTILSQLPSETTQSQTNRSNSAAKLSTPFSNLSLNNNNSNPLPPTHESVSEKQSQYRQPSPPPPTYNTPAPLLTATALYAYSPTDAGDLALAPNDRIAVLEFMNADWWKGRSERTGQEGIFPRSYVREEQGGGGGPGMQSPPAFKQQDNSNGPMSYGNMPVAVAQGPGGAMVQDPRVPSKGEEQAKKFGKKLGNAAIFGAGATIGSNIVNSIF